MSAAVSIYIYDHTPSGQSRLYKHRKSSVHGTISYVVFVRWMENHIKTSMLRLEKMVCCIF